MPEITVVSCHVNCTVVFGVNYDEKWKPIYVTEQKIIKKDFLSHNSDFFSVRFFFFFFIYKIKIIFYVKM